jgi:hypothetical protein
VTVRAALAPFVVAAVLAGGGAASAEPPAAPPPEGAQPSDPGEPPPAAIEAPRSADPVKPRPLHPEYAEYGAAILAMVNISAGATCGASVQGGTAPCILGSGGGLVIRGGYRSPGPWYFGGAYAFAKLDSSNLLRLGIFQQLWAEMRFQPDTGYRAAPYITWGVGGVTYGNEWGVETGGALLFLGGGMEFEVTRLAVVGLDFVYKPTVLAGWTDTAGITRPAGLAQFLGFEVQLEVRRELGRR